MSLGFRLAKAKPHTCGEQLTGASALVPPVRRALGVFALGVAALALLVPAAAQAAAREGVCRTTEVTVAVGAKVTLKLDCRVGKANRVIGGRGRASATIYVKPRRGTLTKPTKAGRTVYTARGAGRDVVRYRVRTRAGKRYRGAIVVRVVGRARSAPSPAMPVASSPPAPQPSPVAQPSPVPLPSDGLPAPLPPVRASVASSTRAWTPSATDTCPAGLHDRFSVVGPDGLRYPTWHPPTVIDPATGRRCTFGHEHGDDPGTSDIAGWVEAHLAAPGYEAYAGLPFGHATEALETYADTHPGTAKRSEDHLGYKVDVADDVPLLGPQGQALHVTCDYLTSVHQGTHSPDALSNNAHELIYATRCTDGTEVISTTLSRFGDPGFYERSCEPETRIATIDNGYPDGDGARLIPDRECVERNVLVPPGRTTSVWALYGGNASPTPFPGGVCQLVSATENAGHADASVQVFGRNRSHDAEGVRAPN